MSDFKNIFIDIALDAANDSVYEPPTPAAHNSSQLHCEHWVQCSNPLCFTHGCLNIFVNQDKEVRS